MKLLAFLALLGAPSVALAAPVHLKCQLDADKAKGGTPWDVDLNEEAGTVSYRFPDLGRAYTVRGIFSAATVTFNGFTVDRTNLKFTRDMGDFASASARFDYGMCSINEVKRVF